jgi:hypothetical protein
MKSKLNPPLAFKLDPPLAFKLNPPLAFKLNPPLAFATSCSSTWRQRRWSKHWARRAPLALALTHCRFSMCVAASPNPDPSSTLALPYLQFGSVADVAFDEKVRLSLTHAGDPRILRLTSFVMCIAHYRETCTLLMVSDTARSDSTPQHLDRSASRMLQAMVALTIASVC